MELVILCSIRPTTGHQHHTSICKHRRQDVLSNCVPAVTCAGVLDGHAVIEEGAPSIPWCTWHASPVVHSTWRREVLWGAILPYQQRMLRIAAQAEKCVPKTSNAH